MLLCPSRQVGWSGRRRQEKTWHWCVRHGRLPSAARWLCQSHVWTWQKEGNVVHILCYVFAFTHCLWSPIVQFFILNVLEDCRLRALFWKWLNCWSVFLFYWPKTLTSWWPSDLNFHCFSWGGSWFKHFALIKLADLPGALGWSRREEGCRQKTCDWFCSRSDGLGENHGWERPACSESSQPHQVFLGDFVMTIVQHLRWVASNSALLSS